jgi:hypothetical protein
MPKSRKLRSKKSKLVKSKQVKKSKTIKSKSKYMNDPIGHRKSLHGKSFTECYDKFNKLKKNTKSGNPTSQSHKEAVDYLKKHLPKCIDIIGDYLIGH